MSGDYTKNTQGLRYSYAKLECNLCKEKLSIIEKSAIKC